jgi:hypothetical protein
MSPKKSRRPVPFSSPGRWGTTSVPFHRELQRRVLFEALYLLETADIPGTIRHLPMPWADVRREAKTLTGQGLKL